MEQCSRCKFWKNHFPLIHKNELNEDDAEGACRRLPPVLHDSWVKDIEEMKLAIQDFRQWSQPTTSGDDWCGEFQPIATHPKD